MLYKKNSAKELDRGLFENPTSEYRGAPFWAWNCRLDGKELERQIEILKEMGFGGFHMHVRSGLETEYLGDEFMDLVKECTGKAEKEKMLAWLYDEDRWPSGFAGGLVTKEEKYRIRYLLFTRRPYENDEKGGAIHHNEQNVASRSNTGSRLIARFSVKLTPDGFLADYRMLDEGESGDGDIWYAYIESPKNNPRYNGYTYANLMDKATIDRFIEVTHEKYYKAVGDKFGTVVPSIFTDEPQMTFKNTLPYPDSDRDITLPWTDDIEDSFREAYGTSLTGAIPELIWELPDGVSQTRYRFHDHVCRRFADAFAFNIGSWCDSHGIKLTGHMMREPSLTSQTTAVGEVMRSLSAFSLPGIDMLADRREFTTAKQAASVAHQYGREGVMSELYGVTDWNYDFRGHKLQGDWQAALGVTVRVPHLAWVSMKGEAKRDYPASINYQSSWYKKYSYVEDHFARLNTALTRGRPLIRVGVIHPVESLWIHWGPSLQTEAARARLDGNFENVTNWLIFGGIDFDYISESLLPSQCGKAGCPLKVGCMSYDAVIVPGCETLRKTTVERLSDFRAAGGKLIFMGDAPEYMDAAKSDAPSKLASASEKIEFSRSALLDALEDVRDISIRNSNGTLTTNLLTQLRSDGGCRWLFICQGTKPYSDDISSRQQIDIVLRGLWRPELWNTLDGSVSATDFRCEGGRTYIVAGLYNHDSLLLKLLPAAEGDSYTAASLKPEHVKEHSGLQIRHAEYTADEPNALLLDICRYRLDGAGIQGPEEVLRADTAIRRALGWGPWGGGANQPWCMPDIPAEHTVEMSFDIVCRRGLSGVKLALENAGITKIVLNGTPVTAGADGWYTDRSIETVPLPELPAGKSELVITFPYGERTAAERVYLLGDFGVELKGSEAAITERPADVGFGDLSEMGFPFYGGAFTYRFEFDTEEKNVEIRIPQYRAAVYEVSLDGGEPVTGAYAPYSTVFRGVSPGRHRAEVKIYLSRYNGFGRIHCADTKVAYPSPGYWRTSGDSWCYEYRLTEQGILSSPVIREFSD